MSSPSWCTNIQNGLQNDLKWTASILIPTTHWCSKTFKNIISPQCSFIPTLDNTLSTECQLCNAINKTESNTIENQIDIVALLNPKTELITTHFIHLCTKHNYPNKAIFQFEQFNGINQKDMLMSYIKNTASLTGTNLVIKSSRNSDNKGNIYEIQMVCSHYGKPKKLNKENYLF